MSKPLSKEEWRTRIAPALARSVHDAEEAITSQPDLQEWLRTASYEAAMSVPSSSDMEAAAMAYGYMLDDLAEQFSPLAEAVRELTGGCARLDLDWRPLSPEYSMIRLNFGTDYRVKTFHRLDALTEETANEALHTVVRALPRSEPFPRRPNEVTGVIAYAGRCLGVRVKARHASDEGPSRSVLLLTHEGRPEQELPLETAPQRILALLRPDDDTVSPQDWLAPRE